MTKGKEAEAREARKYTSNGDLLKNQEEILKRQDDLAKKQDEIQADGKSAKSYEVGEVLKALKAIKDSLESISKKVDNISKTEPPSKSWFGWR